MRVAFLKALLRLQRLKPPGMVLAFRLNAALVSRRWRARAISGTCGASTSECAGQSFHLRRLGPADADLACRFLSSGIPPSESRLIPHRVSPRILRSLLAARGLLVLGAFPAGEEHRLSGYGLCRPTLVGRALFSVLVAPEARCQGLGTELIRRLCEWAWSVDQTPFSIAEAGNVASLRSLEKIGATLTRIGHDFIAVRYERP